MYVPPAARYNDMRLCWNMERLIQITQHCLSDGDPLNPFSSHHPLQTSEVTSPTRKCIRFNQRRFQPGSFVNSTLLQIYITMKSSWRVDRKVWTISPLSTHHLRSSRNKNVKRWMGRRGLFHCWSGSWKMRAIILFLRTPFKLSGQESRE